MQYYLPGLHEDTDHIANEPTSRTSPARTSRIGSIVSKQNEPLSSQIDIFFLSNPHCVT
jgi:hypothetical protein